MGQSTSRDWILLSNDFKSPVLTSNARFCDKHLVRWDQFYGYVGAPNEKNERSLKSVAPSIRDKL